jgi:hypothetical protein
MRNVSQVAVASDFELSLSQTIPLKNVVASTYVAFDDYAYSVAKIEIMRQYALFLADAMERVHAHN